MSSPMRISSGFNWMSFSTVVSCCESERVLLHVPADRSVPVISSVVRRRSVTKPLSFMIFSNCPTALRNL